MIYSSKDRIFGAPPTHGMYIDRADFGGSTPPPTWQPSDEADLDLWYDSSSNTQSGGQVTVAVDKWTTGLDLPFPSVKPDFVPNSLNGQPAWDFPDSGLCGATIVTSHRSFQVGVPASVVMFFDATPLGTGTAAALTFLLAEISTNFVVYLADAIAGFGDLTWGYADGAGGGSISVASYDETGPHYLIINYLGGDPALTSSWEAYRNTVPLTLTTSPALGGVNNTTSIASPVGSSSFHGNWYEQFNFFGSSSDATRRANIHDYFVNKYGSGLMLFKPTWMQRNRKWLIAASAFGAALAGAGALWHYALM